MKMAGSSWSTLWFSKIAPRVRGPSGEIFEAKNAASVFDAASSSVSGDGHTAALANHISFSGMASGMSITAVTVDCDEKMVGDKEFAAGSQGTHVSKIARPWGNPWLLLRRH